MICDPVPTDARSGNNDAEAAERGTARAALALTLVGVTLLLIAGAIWGVIQARRVLLFENPDYRVAAVDVGNGSGLLTRDDILGELGLSERDLRRGVSLYKVDLVSLRRSFLERHPEVRSLTMQRLPPDRISIAVEERWPVARIGHGELVVDDDGVVFSLPPSREKLIEKLPALIDEAHAGLRPGARVGDLALQALTVLRVKRRQNPALDFEIREIDLTGDVYLDLGTAVSNIIRIPMEMLASEREIEKGLRLAAASLVMGQAVPGDQIIVQPGVGGGESRVIIRN